MVELHYSEERDDRRKDTGEIFTPDWLVDKMMIDAGDEKFWSEFIKSEELCIDTTCGSGQILLGYARKGVRLEQILGVDLMPDNIATVKRRLTKFYIEQGMDIKDINYHLERNIICANALTYHYEFWWWKDPSKVTDFMFA